MRRSSHLQHKRRYVLALIGILPVLIVLMPALAKAAAIPVPCGLSICTIQLPPISITPTPKVEPAPSATPKVTPTPRPTATPSPTPVPTFIPPAPTPVPPLTPQANLQAVSQWIFGGANWMVCQVSPLLQIQVDPAKCPPPVLAIKLPQPQDWFAPLYRRMVGLGGLLLLPMLLLALLQSLIRRDPAMALKAGFGYVPLAVILTATAVGMVQSLLTLSDSFTSYMLDGYQGQVAAAIGSVAAVLGAGAFGSAFTLGASAAAVIAALVAIVALLAILFELLIREALIYAAVLFLPLSFAAMVWPRLATWSLKLVEVVLAAIFAKFLIVSILVLGAAAFTAPLGGGPFDSQAPPGTTLLVGLLLVGLAALSPLALLWMLPTFEGAVLAQFRSAGRQPIHAAAHAVQSSIHHLALRRVFQKRAQASAASRPRGPVFKFTPGTQVIVHRARFRQQPPHQGRKRASSGDQGQPKREASGQ
jgi:hypothetical protein